MSKKKKSNVKVVTQPVSNKDEFIKVVSVLLFLNMVMTSYVVLSYFRYSF